MTIHPAPRRAPCTCFSAHVTHAAVTPAPTESAPPTCKSGSKALTKNLRALSRRIGRNIHTLRDEQKLTLRRLSAETNIPIITLDHFELGKNELTLRELFKIASALGVNVIDLFC